MVILAGHTLRGFSWFPTIGAIIGGWAAVWFEASTAVWPEPVIAACLSTSATVSFQPNFGHFETKIGFRRLRMPCIFHRSLGLKMGMGNSNLGFPWSSVLDLWELLIIIL